MLSNNPATSLRTSRQHRRTQSTMAPYPNTDVPTLPNANMERLSAHRRGISLDNRRPTSAQEQYRANDTNTGFNDQPQQQRMMRQGQQQQQSNPFFYNPLNEENYLISPSVTPQRQQSFDGSNRQSFDGGNLMNLYGAPMQQQQYPHFTDSLNLNRPVTADGSMNANQFAGNDFYQQESGAITPSAYIDFTQALEGLNEDWNATIKPVSRPSSRPLSRNFASRVPNPQFEALSAGGSSTRQLTPPSANSSSYFPSPVQTPFSGTVKLESGTIPRRFQDDYDMSLEETIKPSRRSSPHKSNFQQMREQAELDNASRPGSAKMPPSAFFAPPPLPSRSSSQLSNYESPYHSDADTRSERDSPELYKKQLYNDPFTNRALQSAYPELSGSEASRDNSPERNYNARQRTLSVLSLSSASELNPEETIHETGISIDDIAQFISGPDPSDQKYICLYPSCSKRFGRKENIKSHVQTHLGDRQFQCPHCSKCFVRQHDLKRHAKIHSGVKPYPCKCGNSFARHDALTRHRQRGMCVGAFEGVVKKVVKRGRPRKQRPDDEERVGKAEESRSRARVRKGRSDTMTSENSCSESDCSRSSYSMSPAPRDYSHSVDASAFEDGNGAPFPDSAPFPDFVTQNPFRNEAQQQVELERINRNIFRDDQRPEFKYGVGSGGHLQVPTSQPSQPSCVAPRLMLNDGVARGGTVKVYNTETIKAYNTETIKATSSRSVVSNPSPPGLTESFNSSSSPGEIPNFYDTTVGAGVDTDMFIDFGEDASSALAQEATLLSLGSRDGSGGMGNGKGFGDSLGEFGVELDVDPADISLFNSEEGNSWLA